MAQNPQQLPPSKRFKILNSQQMSQPLRETDKHNRNSLPTKKHTKVLGRASTSSYLPAKKHTEGMNPSNSSFLPVKKRLEIDLNSPSTSICYPSAPSTSACIPAKKCTEIINCSSSNAYLPAKKRAEILTGSSTSSCIPAKKRVEILNSSSTSSCLPAKKRVWAPHLSSPAKSDTQAQGADSLVDEKGRLDDGEASKGVPVKKRAWARILASSHESKTQSPVADLIHAGAESQTRGGEETNRLPAKKRVWTLNRLTQASVETKAEVPDLNSVPDKDQFNDAKELKHILELSETQEDITKKWMSAPNPLSATQEINPLSAVQEDTTEKPVSAPKPLSATQATVEKRISAPNPLSATQEGTMKKPVSYPNPLSAIGYVLNKRVSSANPLSANQKQKDTMMELVSDPYALSAIQEDTTKGRVSSPNPLSAIHEDPTKKRVSAQNPTSVLSKDQIKGKGVKETHGVPANRRVSAPNPSSATRDVTANKWVWMENPLSSAVQGNQKEFANLKSAQEEDPVKDVKQAKEIQELTPKKRVWAPNLLSLTTTQTEARINNGEAIHEFPAKKKVHYVHPLSPIAEEKDQTEYHTKVANETSTTVVVKKRIWAPEPLASAKTQIELHGDPEPIKVSTENEFQMDGGDKIHGDPLMKVCTMHLLSPAKTETPNEENSPESIEEEIDDGVLCVVCQSTDGDPSDPIVFCDGCDLMVHASCYGSPLIKLIPEGDWFCLACSSKTSKKEKRCCLCPVKGGALKPTVDGKWAHVMCALLVPEVFFQDPEGRDGIDCSRVPHKRWQKDCFICERNYGCAIDCAESKCKLGFHVSCGLEEGLSIEYKEGKGGDIVAGFCTEHTKLWKKQQSTGKFKIVSKD